MRTATFWPPAKCLQAIITTVTSWLLGSKTCLVNSIRWNFPIPTPSLMPTVHLIRKMRANCCGTAVYQKRFVTERTFAWIDKFKRLLIRFERKKIYFFGFHLLAYTLINLRHVLAKV